MATLQDDTPAQRSAPPDVEDDLIDYSDDEEQPVLAATTSAPVPEHDEERHSVADPPIYDQHLPSLHPITVVWEDQTHSLFHCNALTDSFLLEDDTLVDTPLATLFTACKALLHIDSPASLGFYFTNLCFPHRDPVEIYEEETVCTHVTLRQILDVYLQFHLNDSNTDPAPLEIDFRRRQNAVAVLQDLKTAANDGVGYLHMQSIASNDEEESFGDSNGYEEEYNEEGVVQQEELYEEQYADAEEVDGHVDESIGAEGDNVNGEAGPGLDDENGDTGVDGSYQETGQDYVDEATADFDDGFDEMMQGGDEGLNDDYTETYDNIEVHGDQSETVGIDDTHEQPGDNCEEIAMATFDDTYEEPTIDDGQSTSAEFHGVFEETVHDGGETDNPNLDHGFDQPEQHGDDAFASFGNTCEPLGVQEDVPSFDDTVQETGQNNFDDLPAGIDDTAGELGQDSVDTPPPGLDDDYADSGLNSSNHPTAEFDDSYNNPELNVDENFSVGYDEDSYLEPGQDDNVNATADFDDTYLESGQVFDEAAVTEFAVANGESYDDESQSATVQGEDAVVEQAQSEILNEESTTVQDEVAELSDDQIDNLLGDDTQYDDGQLDEFHLDATRHDDSAAADLDTALANAQDNTEGNEDLILDLELDFEDITPNPAQNSNTAPSTGTTSHANEDDDEDLIDYSDDEDSEPVKTPAASATGSQGVKRALDDDGLDDSLDIKRAKFQSDTSILTT